MLYFASDVIVMLVDAMRRYVCHKCNIPGHLIKDCPRNGTSATPTDVPPPTYV